MTGSGKTLGFILPAIAHLIGQPPRKRGDGPTVLVMLPTRELAKQVELVARTYCEMLGYSLTCCYGGANKNPQAVALQRGRNITIFLIIIVNSYPFIFESAFFQILTIYCRCWHLRGYPRSYSWFPSDGRDESPQMLLFGTWWGWSNAGYGFVEEGGKGRTNQNVNHNS